MREKHCQHCYDEGYKDGQHAREHESEETHVVRISLTDEIRTLYGIPASQPEALALVQGDRIISILGD